MKPNYPKLIASLVVCQLAGLIGAVFTTPAIPTWYAGLMKSPLNPPGWVFGPVWTLLYVLMGVSLYLLWVHVSGSRKMRQWALGFFWVQLMLNTLWSIVFFGWHSPAGALLVITLLWLTIVALIKTCNVISKPAARLLVPYLLWVSFASYLNFTVWQLN